MDGEAPYARTPTRKLKTMPLHLLLIEKSFDSRLRALGQITYMAGRHGRLINPAGWDWEDREVWADEFLCDRQTALDELESAAFAWDYKSTKGDTPLHLFGTLYPAPDPLFLQEFVAAGVSPLATNTARQTPLMLAAFMGYSRLVDFYLQSTQTPQQLEAKDGLGLTAYGYAVLGGNVDCISKIFESGARADLPDLTGGRPDINAGYTHGPYHPATKMAEAFRDAAAKVKLALQPNTNYLNPKL